MTCSSLAPRLSFFMGEGAKAQQYFYLKVQFLSIFLDAWCLWLGAEGLLRPLSVASTMPIDSLRGSSQLHEH